MTDTATPIKFFVGFQLFMFTDGTAQCEELARGPTDICQNALDAVKTAKYRGPKQIWEAKTGLIEAEKYDAFIKELEGKK